MSQYAMLDALILSACDRQKSPLYDRDCTTEARRLAIATGRESFRVIDGRVQALRKAGRIEYSAAKWHLAGSAGGQDGKGEG